MSPSGLDDLDEQAQRARSRRHRTPPPPKRSASSVTREDREHTPRRDPAGDATAVPDSEADVTQPAADGARTPIDPSATSGHGSDRIEWTLHARQIRSGLMAWVSAMRKVEQRVDDVRETIRMAGTGVDEQTLAAIVADVADRSGLNRHQVADVVGIHIEQ